VQPEPDLSLEVPATLGTLIGEFFRAVSFDEGQRPPYEVLHDLFMADGKLIRNSGESPEISNVGEFIGARRAMIDAGELTSFYEGELANVTEIFGNVAHRFSTYEKRGMLNGVPLLGRGMISTQFIRTPTSWRISSMAWDDERPGLVIPDRYLTGVSPQWTARR
jgi:hypothetical protein